jgi:hypothetical protein
MAGPRCKKEEVPGWNPEARMGDLSDKVKDVFK